MLCLIIFIFQFRLRRDVRLIIQPERIAGVFHFQVHCLTCLSICCMRLPCRQKDATMAWYGERGWSNSGEDNNNADNDVDDDADRRATCVRSWHATCRYIFSYDITSSRMIRRTDNGLPGAWTYRNSSRSTATMRTMIKYCGPVLYLKKNCGKINIHQFHRTDTDFCS